MSIDDDLGLESFKNQIEEIEARIQKQYLKEWDEMFAWVKPGQLFRVNDSRSRAVQNNWGPIMKFHYFMFNGKKVFYQESIPVGSIVMFVQLLKSETVFLESLEFVGANRLQFERTISGPIWLYGEKLISVSFKVTDLEPIGDS